MHYRECVGILCPIEAVDSYVLTLKSLEDCIKPTVHCTVFPELYVCTLKCFHSNMPRNSTLAFDVLDLEITPSGKFPDECFAFKRDVTGLHIQCHIHTHINVSKPR